MAQLLNGRLLESARTDYADKQFGMKTQEQRKMYLKTLSKMLTSDTSDITGISEIKELCSIIMLGDEQENDDGTRPLETEKQHFVQQIREVIQQRNTPINDILELYKIKLPKDLSFIYEEIMSTFESMVANNELGDVSEELVSDLSKATAKNGRIQELLVELLSRQYKEKGVLTEQFIEETYSGARSAEDFDEKNPYLLNRAEAYLRSIGVEKNSMQHRILMKLQSDKVLHDRVIRAPQYVSYKNILDNQEDAIIFSTKPDRTNCYIPIRPTTYKNRRRFIKTTE